MRKITALFLVLIMSVSLCNTLASCGFIDDFISSEDGTQGVTNDSNDGVDAGNNNTDGSSNKNENKNDEDAIDENLIFTENDYGSYTVTKYTGSAKSVTIPRSYNGKAVTIIGMSAFADCTSLESIAIGDRVTEIESGAFTRCYNLKEVTLSNSLILIAPYAFRDCTSLTSLVLPSSIKAVAFMAFKGCTSLESVEFPYADKNCWVSNSDMYTTTGGSVGGTQYNASDPEKNAKYLTTVGSSIYYRNR